MKFSKKSEYALRALIELTANYEQAVPVQRTQLAREQRIPLGFLEGILLTLKNAGILSSRRGVDGGYRLRSSPSEITLGQVIRTLDGPLAPIGCVSQTAYQKCEDCPYAEKSACAIQSIMLEVRNAISSVLDHYTLEDFVKHVDVPRTQAKASHAKKNPAKKRLLPSK
ncbi:MAG: Rrf2 family transcriptional regulator [Nitrospirales bacterium]|nr:Rrf2 family transcriptional regulator [Nitrospira sp.]MDR4499836.1 Rrf2 family transcriptional regulator [Nitrospirales bacterium]